MRRRTPAQLFAVALLIGVLQLPGCDGDGDPVGSLEPSNVLGGLARLQVPTAWEVERDGVGLFVASQDGEAVVTLSVTRVPSDGIDDLDEAVRATIGADGAISAAAVPGATTARRIERETAGGLWQRGVIARTGDGRIVLVVLAADADHAPDDELTERILASLSVAGSEDAART